MRDGGAGKRRRKILAEAKTQNTNAETENEKEEKKNLFFIMLVVFYDLPVYSSRTGEMVKKKMKSKSFLSRALKGSRLLKDPQRWKTKDAEEEEEEEQEKELRRTRRKGNRCRWNVSSLADCRFHCMSSC